MLKKMSLIFQRWAFARCLISQYIPKRNNTWQSRNPREPHYERKRMLEICKPIYDEPVRQPWETCGYNSILPFPVEAHPYETLVAKELESNWYSSKMICFFHINPMTLEEEKKIRNTFTKKNLHFHIYTKSVVKLVLENSPFKSCLHLCQPETAFVFGAETSAAEVLNLSKKMTHIVMLAAVVNGIFFSKNQLQDYSQLPTIDVLHSQFSALLSSKLSNISHSIVHPSRVLSHTLQQLSSSEQIE